MDRDWTTPRFRMAYLWWGRDELTPWDDRAVAAYNDVLGALGPALVGLGMKQWGILCTSPGRFSSLRKRPCKGPAFEAYRASIGDGTESVDFSLSSGSLETGAPEFYSELYWTTRRQVAGTRPFRPPNNAPALVYSSVIVDRDLLASTVGSKGFDEALGRFAAALGTHRGGILVDRPWHHDPPSSNRFGQAGPTGARLNLLAMAPLRDGASDLDTWSPPFDIVL